MTTRFKTGARPSPRHKLLAAPAHRPAAPPPPQAAYVPPRLSYWGNESDGDCVTAEEAFAKACASPEIFVPEETAVAWAAAHGVLNGAVISDVLEWMQSDGFVVAGRKYNNGPHSGVDYGNETVLHSAISVGPVKVGIDHRALTAAAGERQGWFSSGGRPGQYADTDHCVSLCGYGTAGWLYGRLGVPVPAALQASRPGYLLFTWGTIGFVDYDWVMSTVGEAWLRDPTTVGPPPGPPPPPPPPPPGPGPLFTLKTTRAVARGGLVWFPAPTPMPAGTLLTATPPAAAGFAGELHPHTECEVTP